MTEDLLDDLFHRCALAAGCIAYAEGRLSDSLYVRQLCYGMYEDELARKNGPKSPQQSTAKRHRAPAP